MKEVIVKSNQNLYDISAQETGTSANVVRIAQVNNLAVTTSLIEGSAIMIPLDIVIKKQVKEYLTKNNCTPATIK